MDVRIYQPTKTAMQSGRAKTNVWILEFSPLAQEKADELMGWIGGGNTLKQLQMKFESKEQAIAYAQKHNLTFKVIEPNQRKLNIKSYADNFSYTRII